MEENTQMQLDSIVIKKCIGLLKCHLMFRISQAYTALHHDAAGSCEDSTNQRLKGF